jgi:hypothetical protein
MPMEPIADKKIHFAPLEKQWTAIQALLRDGEYRNVTELMRLAVDHYLAARGRPPLTEQVRQMAEDYHTASEGDDPGALQDESMETGEAW